MCYLSKKATTLPRELMRYIIPLSRGVQLSIGAAALPPGIAQGAHQALNLWHVGVLEACKVLSRIPQCCCVTCKHITKLGCSRQIYYFINKTKDS